MADKIIRIQVIADTKKVQTGMAKANASLGNFQRGIERLQRALVAFVGIYLFRQLIRGIGESIQAFAQFEKGIANIGILLGSEIGRLGEFQGAIERLSMQFGIASEDILRSGFDIQSAINDVSKSLDVMEAAAALATAGGSDMASTTAGLLTLMESYGHKLKGAADGANLLLKAQEKARATIGELSTSVSKFLPVAAQMGIEVEALFAVYAQLTRALGNTREASTALGMFLMKLLKPTEAMIRLAKAEWGMSVQRALATKGLAEVLRVLSSVEIEELGTLINRQRAIKAVTSLTGEYGKIVKWTAEMMDREGYVQEKLGLQTETLEIKLKKLKETTAVTGRAIGENFGQAAEAMIGLATAALFAINSQRALNKAWGQTGPIEKAAIGIVNYHLQLLGLKIPFASAIEGFKQIGIEGYKEAAAVGVMGEELKKLNDRLKETRDIFAAEEAGRIALGLPEMTDEMAEDFAENMGRMVLGVQSVQEGVAKLNKEILTTPPKVLKVSEAFIKMQKEAQKHFTQMGSILSSLADVFEMAQGESEKFKNVIKGIRIAETIIHTAAAVMQCYAQFGPVVGSVYAGIVGGIGAAKVALIASMKKGGMVPGVGVGDKVPALLEPGELVVSRENVSKVLNNTYSPNVAININGGIFLDDPIQVQRLYREYLRDTIRDDIRTGKDTFYG